EDPLHGHSRFLHSEFAILIFAIPWQDPEFKIMRDIQTLFADYAAYHQTKGNKWFHRIGIPLIMLTLLGMLARVGVSGGGLRIDLAMLLIVVAEVVYLMLDWRLGAVMLAVSVGFYFLGAWMPLWLDAALFV